ncbi:hypothetical protein D7V86_15185 [bacterium D16-51]|nr:hypothetical protein D7V96_20600 [bacterium D16-59]RKI58769.1 hypothetical protein D7V86_15185 [bacterium D16-51]
MEDKFVDDLNASPSDLLSRMEFVGKQVQNDKSPAYRILSIFFESKPFNVSLARFIFESDFLNCVNEKNFLFITKLIENKASVLWFWIILSAFDERADEFDNFCEAFSKSFFSGINIDDLYTCYQSCMTVDEMNQRLLLLEKNMKENKDVEFQGENVLTNLDCKKNDKMDALDQQAIMQQLKQKNKELTDKNNIYMNENCVLRRQIEDLNGNLSNLHGNLETAYRKIMLYERELWEFKVKVEHIKKIPVKNNAIIKMVEGKNKQLLQKVESLECFNQTLQQRIEELGNRLEVEQQEYRILQERYSDKESENAGLLNEIGELRKIINQIENNQDNDLNDAVIAEISGLEDMKKSAGNACEEPDEKEILYNESDLEQISDGMENLMKKSSLFSQLFAKLYEKKFNKKPQMEQENIIFIKMMELKFAQEKVLIIKRMLKNNNQFSRLDLYKLIAKNPSEEELEEFCNAVSAA